MVHEQIVQASADLKGCISQILVVNGNLSEDIIPPLKLNQLRYTLSNTLLSVENLFKLYAQYDTPQKLFSATWNSASNSMKTCNTNNFSGDIKSESSVYSQQTASSSSLPEKASTSDFSTLLQNAEKTELTFQFDKNQPLNCNIKSSPFTNSSGESIQISCKPEVVIDLLSSEKCEIKSTNERKGPDQYEVASESQNNEVEPKKFNINNAESYKHNFLTDKIVTEQKISARELLATKRRFGLPNAPGKIMNKRYATSVPPYLQKHFLVVKNKTHFSVIKKPNYTHSVPSFSSFPPLQACKMCGYFNDFRNQSWNLGLCSNCKSAALRTY